MRSICHTFNTNSLSVLWTKKILFDEFQTISWCHQWRFWQRTICMKWNKTKNHYNFFLLLNKWWKKVYKETGDKDGNFQHLVEKYVHIDQKSRTPKYTARTFPSHPFTFYLYVVCCFASSSIIIFSYFAFTKSYQLKKYNFYAPMLWMLNVNEYVYIHTQTDGY